jgi:hypothetical protein
MPLPVRIFAILNGYCASGLHMLLVVQLQPHIDIARGPINGDKEMPLVFSQVDLSCVDAGNQGIDFKRLGLSLLFRR